MDFQEFRNWYISTHPSSVPVKKVAMLPYPMFLPWLVLIMFIGAVVLSSVHTIPVMYQAIPTDRSVISDEIARIAAHFSVIVIELSLFVSVYSAASAASTGADRSKAYYVIQAVAFIGAMAANLYSVSHSSLAENLGGAVTGVVVGTLPPLVALLTGEVYVKMH